MTLDDKMKNAAEIHPLLPAKLKMDEEERMREGVKYKLLYEKTYAGEGTDIYESSITATNNEEAIKYAQDKLFMKDALARWDTNITDAVLIAPNGEKLLIPDFSKKLRKK